MKEMSKKEILKWWDVFEPSPWGMFIHLEKPTFADGKTINGIIHAFVKNGEFYSVTGISEIDEKPIKSAEKYHCDVN